MLFYGKPLCHRQTTCTSDFVIYISFYLSFISAKVFKYRKLYLFLKFDFSSKYL